MIYTNYNVKRYSILGQLEQVLFLTWKIGGLYFLLGLIIKAYKDWLRF